MAIGLNKLTPQARAMKLECEEFKFVDPKVILKPQREYAYRWELGREALSQNEKPEWLPFLQGLPAIGGLFPGTPWLKIPAGERSACIHAITVGRNGVRHAWPWDPPQSPLFRTEYPLKAEGAEGEVEAYLDHGMCDACKKLLREIRRWRASQDEDVSLPRICGSIDLSVPDSRIVAAFKTALADVRRNAQEGSVEVRVAKDSGATTIEQKLRRLAIARLKRAFGSPTKALDFMSRQGMEGPHEGNLSAWYRAVKFIRGEISGGVTEAGAVIRGQSKSLR